VITSGPFLWGVAVGGFVTYWMFVRRCPGCGARFGGIDPGAILAHGPQNR
jgi:hypothetical protein